MVRYEDALQQLPDSAGEVDEVIRPGELEERGVEILYRLENFVRFLASLGSGEDRVQSFDVLRGRSGRRGAR